jgi:hypothetical protein
MQILVEFFSRRCYPRRINYPLFFNLANGRPIFCIYSLLKTGFLGLPHKADIQLVCEKTQERKHKIVSSPNIRRSFQVKSSKTALSCEFFLFIIIFYRVWFLGLVCYAFRVRKLKILFKKYNITKL